MGGGDMNEEIICMWKSQLERMKTIWAKQPRYILRGTRRVRPMQWFCSVYAGISFMYKLICKIYLVTQLFLLKLLILYAYNTMVYRY